MNLGVDELECYHILYGLSDLLHPQSYLEVGVREGASLVCVLAKEKSIIDFSMKCLMDGRNVLTSEILERISEVYTDRDKETELYLFENWSYKLSDGGHNRLVSLLKTGFSHKNYSIFDGDSKTTLPQFFKKHPEKIDLVYVDGDHSVEGVWSDLNNVCDRFKVLVVHDLFHPEHNYIINVFRQYVVSHELPHLIFGRNRYGVGVAFDVF